jgi:PKD repeat protein
MKRADSKSNIPFVSRVGLISPGRRGRASRPREYVVAWALTLGLLIFGASNVRATDLVWTGTSGDFNAAENWDPAQTPADYDTTLFTNDTSYTVSFSADSPRMYSAIFTGHAGVVTLDIGTSTWSLTNRFYIGVNDATATVYLASGTLAVTNVGPAQIRIGDTGGASVGTLVVTNGTVIADAITLGGTAGAVGKLVISDSGVVTNSANPGTLTVGLSGSGCQLIITNGGKLFLAGETRIGNNGTASQNFALISGPSCLMSNGTGQGFRVGAGGSRGNLMIVSNGATVFASNGGTIGGNGGGTAFNTGIVVGVGTRLISGTGDIRIAPNNGGSTNNNFTVYDGALLICGGTITVGGNTAAISNSFNMGGVGATSTGSAAVVTFNSASELNRVIVTNAVFNTGTVSIQGKTNSILVLADARWIMTTNLTTSGSALGASFTVCGGFVSNEAGILIGAGTSAGSQLIITNGGTLLSNYGTIGAGAAFCTGIVVGVGSVWSNTGPSIFVGTGAGGVGNRLTVANGATLYNAGTLNIATDPAGQGNTVCIGGAGAPADVVNDGLFNVGSVAGSYSNKLTVTNAVLTCGTLTIGVADATNNLLELKSGTISVPFLQVGGTNSIAFNAGTLSTGGTAVDDLANTPLGSATVVGDGSSPAYLDLAAGGTGFHQFGAGLVITNNATLRGAGAIIGNVTVLGALSPGFSIGTITTSNDLVLGSSAVLSYDLGASNDLTVVNGDLALDGTLDITDAGGFGVGTYTLFTYTGALTDNGLTVGTTPDAGLVYTIDTGTAGLVTLNVQEAPPVAAFSGSPTTGEAPLPVTFTDTSTGSITNRFWAFGDGGTTNTTATSVDHTYNLAGTYTVSLTAFGPGGSDTQTQSDYILATNPPPPVAAFSGSPTNGQAALTVTFTDTSTGNITNRFWDFGDGGTTNTIATSVDHTYNLAGTFTVSLTVSGLGGTDAANRPDYIVVEADTTPPNLQIDQPTDYETTSNANIAVSGTASDASGISSVTVNGAAATLVSTNWSKSITLSSGTNTITVIATDNSVDLNTATQVVHAVLSPTTPTNHPPQITAALSVTNALLEVGAVAVVVANGTNIFAVTATDADSDPLDYQWIFGDGGNTNTSFGIVEHVYTNDCGPYSASVTVSDAEASTNSDLTVAVACELRNVEVQMKPNFKKPSADKFNLRADVDLPGGFNPDGKSVTVDVGGAQASFSLDAKGRGTNALGTCRLSFNTKTSDWTVKVKQRKGSWQTPWNADGLVNVTVSKPITVTAVVLVDTEGFAVDASLRYTAKANKSGVAK